MEVSPALSCAGLGAGGLPPVCIDNDNVALYSQNGTSWGRSRRQCKCLRSRRLATWNIEGLCGSSIVKQVELMQFMQQRDVDILCIQETHLCGAEYKFIDGLLWFFSGIPAEEPSRNHSGVGFVVAPWAVSAVISFNAHSERLASLKLRVSSGTLTIESAYSPHSGHAVYVRQHFFTDLRGIIRAPTNHSTMIILGDFNARLLRSLPGEDGIIGPHVFHGPGCSAESTTSNKHFLLECCVAHGLVVANTFFDHTDDNKVTYRDVGTRPLDNIAAGKFAQIDHVLCHQPLFANLTNISSNRLDCINSHHFVTLVDVDVAFHNTASRRAAPRDVGSLNVESVQRSFLNTFVGVARAADGLPNLDEQADRVSEAFSQASRTLPLQRQEAKRPWISASTLFIIASRNEKMRTGDFDGEKYLNKAIRREARIDRRRWLENALADGSWLAVKRLRHKPAVKHATIQDLDGNLTGSAERSETLADYFEKIQWQVQFADIFQRRLSQSDRNFLSTFLPSNLQS